MTGGFQSASIATIAEQRWRKTMGEDSVMLANTYGYSERKWIRGKYTDDDMRYNDYSYRCNRCRKIVDFEENYCPKCGARMEGGENT